MKYLWTILACCPLLAMAQSKTFTIEGKAQSYNAPAKAYLMYGDGGKNVDSVQINKGSFSFKGTLENSEPLNAILMIDKKGLSIRQAQMAARYQFYLEPGKIKAESPDSLDNFKISGTKTNQENQKLQTLLEPSNQEIAQLMQDYRKATPEQYKDSLYTKPFMERYNKLSEEQKKISLAFARQHPNSFVSLNAIIRSSGAFPDYASNRELLNGLSTEIRNSSLGQEFSNQLEAVKATSIGAMAPEFTQPDVNGKPVSLKDFRGKYVLVDFWASWCSPCRAENPNVVKSYQAYKDKNFTVLGVSLDQPSGKNAWLKAIEKDGLPWTQVSDLSGWKNAAAQVYAVRAIPQNFLIDPQGKIIAKNIRGEDLGKKLAELIR